MSQGDGNGPPCNISRGTTFTVRVLQSYADPTRTSIVYKMSTNGNYSTVSDGNLIDASGNDYHPIQSSGDENQHAYAVYQPLPAQSLQSTQHMTLDVTNLVVFGRLANHQQCISSLNGSWETTFTVTPVTGTMQTLDVAAQTHNGITIQPVSLNWCSRAKRPSIRSIRAEADSPFNSPAFPRQCRLAA